MRFKRIQGIPLTFALALTGIQVGSPSTANALSFEANGIAALSHAGAYNASSLSAQEGSATQIVFGQTIQGALGDANDFVNSNGAPFDLYVLEVPESSKGYVITVSSPTFAAGSTLAQDDPAQQTVVPLQTAFVHAPTGQVQYSGSLSQPGRYLIDVGTVDGNTGNYTLSLHEAVGEPPNSSSCNAANPDNPIEIGLNQPVDCALSSTDDVGLRDTNEGIHYAKVFRFQSAGGLLTINASSQAFTPGILTLDPASGQIVAQEVGTLSTQFPPGDVIFLIASTEVEATGPFTVVVEDSTNDGGTEGISTFSESAVPQLYIDKR